MVVNQSYKGCALTTNVNKQLEPRLCKLEVHEEIKSINEEKLTWICTMLGDVSCLGMSPNMKQQKEKGVTFMYKSIQLKWMVIQSSSR